MTASSEAPPPPTQTEKRKKNQVSYLFSAMTQSCDKQYQAAPQSVKLVLWECGIRDEIFRGFFVFFLLSGKIRRDPSLGVKS